MQFLETISQSNDYSNLTIDNYKSPKRIGPISRKPKIEHLLWYVKEIKKHGSFLTKERRT